MLDGLDVSVGGWADGEMPAVAARCVPGAIAVGVAKAGEVACAPPATGWCGCAPMVVAKGDNSRGNRYRDEPDDDQWPRQAPSVAVVRWLARVTGPGLSGGRMRGPG